MVYCTGCVKEGKVVQIMLTQEQKLSAKLIMALWCVSSVRLLQTVSYVQGRRQCVVTNNAHSHWTHMISGADQVEVMSSYLFLLYMSSWTILVEVPETFGYADDKIKRRKRRSSHFPFERDDESDEHSLHDMVTIRQLIPDDLWGQILQQSVLHTTFRLHNTKKLG